MIEQVLFRVNLFFKQSKQNFLDKLKIPARELLYISTSSHSRAHRGGEVVTIDRFKCAFKKSKHDGAPEGLAQRGTEGHRGACTVV